MVTLPPLPTGTMTKLGMFWLANSTLRFDDAPICDWPVGNTWMNPGPVVPAAVTFNATAVTPLAGTLATPVTVTSIEPLGATFALAAPRPSRVSRMRVGASGTNFDGAPGAAS